MRVNRMAIRLGTDEQFESAYLKHSTVYVKSKRRKDAAALVGSLEAFNPFFVTVSGRIFARDEHIFRTVR